MIRVTVYCMPGIVDDGDGVMGAGTNHCQSLQQGVGT